MSPVAHRPTRGAADLHKQPRDAERRARRTSGSGTGTRDGADRADAGFFVHGPRARAGGRKTLRRLLRRRAAATDTSHRRLRSPRRRRRAWARTAPENWDHAGFSGTCACDVTKEKGKEEHLYSAFSHQGIHTKRSGVDHTVLPANNTMPAFPSWRSSDVTTTATEAADIQLQLITHLSTPKG